MIVILGNEWSRKRAYEAIANAPAGHVCEVREPRRTNAQNDLLWALIGDVAASRPGGRVLTPDQWKCLFMDAVSKETNNASFTSRWEPALDGEGVVNTGYRSSRLRKSEMGDLISFIQAWGSENGVRWSDERDAA